MKTDIKLLKILYFVGAILVLLLYFSYQKEPIVKKEYSYDIEDTAEEENAVGYKIKINELYQDEILIKISKELENEYCKLYKIEKPSEKVDDFFVYFYYDDELYKKYYNEKIMED